jgi:hypothetical protein
MPTRGSGTGVHLHEKGYLRVGRRGPYRGWLVHRVVMLEMCQEFCYYELPENKTKLPVGMTVEHLDHKRTHNCSQNLMLLDKRIHDKISGDYAVWIAGVQASRVSNSMMMDEADEPDWVTD